MPEGIASLATLWKHEASHFGMNTPCALHRPRTELTACVLCETATSRSSMTCTISWRSSSRSATGWNSSRSARASFAIMSASFSSFFRLLVQIAASLRALPTTASQPHDFASALIQRQQRPVSIATVASAFSSKNAVSASGVLATSRRHMTLPAWSNAHTIVIYLLMAVFLSFVVDCVSTHIIPPFEG